ncbi:telomere repeats-binding bouquet formation protein 2 [Nelusetta ayraudi]|uniref:telomere repeats-binding bouquet formation protein 2 n=1 Tax=Nelusetta ayraudi TaxID=303726 RepID=UPI003F705766
MFRKKSAWFSNSVPETYRQLWAIEGGSSASWRTADYLFSEDADCPDTQRIFESRDYHWNKVVVFHSMFLLACEKRQSVKSVCIGHYVLPPASVQHEVRNIVGRLIWESEDEQSVKPGPSRKEWVKEQLSSCHSKPSDTDSSKRKSSQCASLLDYPVNDLSTGYISVDNLPKYLGHLCDFHPRCLQLSSCKKDS